MDVQVWTVRGYAQLTAFTQWDDNAVVKLISYF